MLNPRQEVSGEQRISYSPTHEDPAKIKEIIELTLTGQLTAAVLVPVLPAYQDLLDQIVWFCPDQETAEEKAPNLAFISEELEVIIPLLIENREFASTLISAKKIFGGTIKDPSLSDLAAATPYYSYAESEDFKNTEKDETFDPAISQYQYQNNWIHRDREGGVQPPHGGQPTEGRHLVRVIRVLGFLHSFPDYTAPRARIVMEILEGIDVGKTIVDNVSLPHPKESKGMLQRRVRIACRLGLIPWRAKGTVQVNWKSLQGVICWVDVIHRKFKGHQYAIVDNYQLHSTTQVD